MEFQKPSASPIPSLDASLGAEGGVDPQIAPRGEARPVGDLNEDLALALLKHADVKAEEFENLAANSSVMKRRKVRIAIAAHPRAPRHISLPLLRLLYTFDLMNVALTPATPADIKRSAEELLVNRLETISSGEKMSLARRASGRVAGRLLLDPDQRVMRAALENPRLTENLVVAAVVRRDSTQQLVESVCRHPKWSARREIRIALLRNDKTPLASALEYARTLPVPMLREILQHSALPSATKLYLQRTLAGRPTRPDSASGAE